MLSVDEARERILASVRTGTAKPVALSACHGLVLAQHVRAETPVPPFRNAAMDGYAVRSVDARDAAYDSPVRLRITGNLPAGVEPDRSVGSGEAIRIMTGAAMPDGADAVVRFEETNDPEPGSESNCDNLDWVSIYRAPACGDNVRQPGEDIPEGTHIFSPGLLIDAAVQGVLASTNHASVAAIPRPLVAILATGDEVVDPGESLNPGQIRNSNNYTIAGLVEEAGAIPEIIGIARDTESSIRASLVGSEKYDLLITSGGVSLGDYDMVKDVLRSEGSIDLWQVRIKPGKPMAFGQIGGVPLIGLPGNPVAAYVAFLQFAAPAIARMRGLKDASDELKRARLLQEHENRGNRRHFVRGIYWNTGAELVVEPVTVQGSGVLTALVRANCLFVIPEDMNHAPAGTMVDVVPLAR